MIQFLLSCSDYCCSGFYKTADLACCENTKNRASIWWIRFAKIHLNYIF